MKKLLVFLGLALVLTFPGLVQAEGLGEDLSGDLSGKYAISIMFKGIFPEEDEADNTILWGGAVEYYLNEYMAVEVEAGYASISDEYEGVEFGEISFVPLLANFKVRYPEGQINPFVYAGVGVLFPNYKEAGWIENLGISVDMSPGFAFQVGAGADFWVVENIALFAKGGYLWSEVEAEASAFGVTAKTDLNVNHFFCGGGAKIVF